MPRHAIVCASFAALLLSACTQSSPAMVDLKGQNTYGKSNYAGAMAFGALSPSAGGSRVMPIPPLPVQAAAVQSVAISDLAPASGSAPAAAPRVNPWTGNARPAQLKPIVQAANAPAVQPKAIVRDRGAYIWPVSGKKVLSAYGPKGGGKVNDGINIAAAEGEPVWAAADGEVVYVGNGLASYGNMVLVKHDGDKTTAYAHMSRATVEKYDRIKQGDIIGYVGSSGNVKEPQLHFAIRDGKTPVDPSRYLSRSLAGL